MKDGKQVPVGGAPGRLIIAGVVTILGIAAAVWVYAARGSTSCVTTVIQAPVAQNTASSVGPSTSTITTTGPPAATNSVNPAPTPLSLPQPGGPSNSRNNQQQTPLLQPTLPSVATPGLPGVLPGGDRGSSQPLQPTLGAGIGTGNQQIGPAQANCQQRSSALPALVALVELVAGGAVVALVRPGRGRPATEQPPSGRVDPAGPAAATRASLIGTLLWLRDRQASPALVAKVDQDLAGLGIRRRDLVGKPYDPTWQEASGQVPTSDPQLAGLIAEVHSDAWFDSETLVRAPTVAVYRVGP